MTPGESIARCRWAARGYFMARMWWEGYVMREVAAWYGVPETVAYDALRLHSGRRR